MQKVVCVLHKDTSAKGGMCSPGGYKGQIWYRTNFKHTEHNPKVQPNKTRTGTSRFEKIENDRHLEKMAATGKLDRGWWGWLMT